MSPLSSSTAFRLLFQTLTVAEAKNPVSAHVAILRHTLTNLLEHGDAIVPHDSGVQILADVFAAHSAETQSPPNAWLGRSAVLSLGA